MDEVDKIIVHSLRQIGCRIDGDCTMANFTPSLLVHAVSSCLQQIKPDTANLPRTLSEGLPMAQRFSVATTLAELCASCGYRSDIGYQTFLYPNAVEVRRLLMFLIEQLPRDSRTADEPDSQHPLDESELLHREIKRKLLQQLRAPWVPQYCRAVGNRRYDGCSSQCLQFAPQHNLNVPGVEAMPQQVHYYMQHQAPSIFQQTAGEKFELISSVLHKNALDLHSVAQASDLSKCSLAELTSGSSRTALEVSTAAPTVSDIPQSSTRTPLEKLTEQVHLLKCQNDEVLVERKAMSTQLNGIKLQQSNVHANIEQLQKDGKIHERTCVVLENPKENVAKLEGLIQTAQERRKALEQQWQEYRQPMLSNLSALKTAKQAKNVQNVVELRAVIEQLEHMLRDKTNSHAKLSAELKSTANGGAAPRKEYTRRILEFIANIRKQRNDIYKVLDDTRDLQKQLNSVSAQLQRQFSYTDDLLFQTAKHDMHAKKAYKLLAALHATCNELIELVAQTGNATKAIRELEVQIDRERLKNIAQSLEQISADIRNFENVICSIQAEIHKVENEITAG